MTRDIVWTADAIRALGPFTTLQTAAAIFGLSKTHAYDLAATGTFPIPVLKIGHRYRVPVAAILTAAHLTPTDDDRPDVSGAEAVDLTGARSPTSIDDVKSIAHPHPRREAG